MQLGLPTEPYIADVHFGIAERGPVSTAMSLLWAECMQSTYLDERINDLSQATAESQRMINTGHGR